LASVATPESNRIVYYMSHLAKFAAAAHGQSVIWVDAKSADLFDQDWKVYAARVGQSKPALLGDSLAMTKTDEVPPPPGVTILTTDGAQTWWTMTYQTKSQRLSWGARIMVRDLAGREPLTTAVDKAKLPAATSGASPTYARVTSTRASDGRCISIKQVDVRIAPFAQPVSPVEGVGPGALASISLLALARDGNRSAPDTKDSAHVIRTAVPIGASGKPAGSARPAA
jgi:hypothetical protein